MKLPYEEKVEHIIYNPMKILFLGDFSTVNLNLKFGLEKLGHQVTLVSHGDGFKALDSDIKVYTRKKDENKYIGAFKEIADQYKVSRSLKGFDIVQTAAHFFYHNRVDKFLFPKIFEQNNKTVLLNTACSVPYNSYVRTLKYSACSDCKAYDLIGNKCVHETHQTQIEEYNRYERYNAIVSTHFEYFNAFNLTPFKNKNYFIPVGIRTELFEAKNEEFSGDKITVYYGEIRKGFKGGKFIEEALNKIEGSNYAKFFNIIRTSKLKYSDYLKIIEQSQIVIDQASSYSYGVNVLIGLAMGKVVFGGAEPEAIELITNDRKECPVINVLPNADDIFNKLVWFLDNKHLLAILGSEGRDFVIKYHSVDVVAKKYEELYLSL